MQNITEDVPALAETGRNPRKSGTVPANGRRSEGGQAGPMARLGEAVPLQRKRVSGGTLEDEAATEALRAQMRASIIHDFQVLLKTQEKRLEKA